MMEPNYELLKDAYAIIGGIPDEAFRLSLVVTRRGESLECGTIACAAGWLGMHPQFQALGLGVDKSGGGILTINGKSARFATTYTRQMALIFNMPDADMDALFSSRRERGDATDKVVWLRRVRTYLASKGQLSQKPTFEETQK